MRFAELHIIKYGFFDGCDLKFPRQSASDLQIIYGPNEAGKSTTLAAVSDFLFGFPHTTKYDFLFDKQLLRIGATIEAEGKQLSLRRRKGIIGTLLSESEQPVSDAILANLLKGQTVETFHRMFGLDHARLRDGGQAILDARDDVGQAIFAAGSGLVGVTRMLEDLDDQAKAIWAPRANATRTYYLAQKRFDEARTNLRAALLRPARWEELRKTIEEAKEGVDELRTRRTELEMKRRRLERRRRILPAIAKRKLLEESLAALSSVPEFPLDASVRFTDIEKTIVAAVADKRAASDRAKIASDELSTLIVDDKVLKQSTEIESLKEQRSAIAGDLRDLPRRRAERDSLNTRIEELQKELAWQPELPSALREKIPSIVRIAEVRDLLARIGAAEAVVAKSSDDVDEQNREVNELERKAKTLRPAADTATLSAALRFALAKGDVDGDVRERMALHDRAIASRQDALLRVSPWSGTIESLRALVMPTTSRAAEFVSKLAQAALDQTREQDSVEADKDRRKRLILEQTHATRDDRAVSLEALMQSRHDRDRRWAPLRAHLSGQHSLEHPDTEAEVFEKLVRRADELGDQRFAVAEKSGRLVALAEDMERLDLTIEEGERKIAATKAMIAELTTQWLEEVSALGVRLSPSDFISWIGRRDAALDADEKVTHAAALVTQAREEREAVRKALLDAFDAGAWPIEPGIDTIVIVELADERIKIEAEVQRTQANHKRDIEAAQNNLSRALTKNDTAKKELKALADRWMPALHSMHFEDNASAAVVRARLDLLDQLRRTVDDVLALDHRIETMEANVRAFTDSVKAVATACGRGDGPNTAVELLADLVTAVNNASAGAQKRDGLKARLGDEAEKEVAADRSLELSKERLEPLLKIGSVQDKEALRSLLAASDRRAAQQRELSSLESEIVSLGDGLSLNALLDEAKDADPDALKLESDATESLLATLHQEIEELTARQVAARKDFDGLNTGPDAVIAASEMAFAKSEMEAQAESYVRLRAEATLLRWAIERYRREKQAPLLSRASELFSVLTLGKYSALMVDTETDRPRLCGLFASGTRLIPVDAMSEGTVDQLYLALRLAAVEDAVANGIDLPFWADDLFINYDDERAAAGFRVLADLSKKTQVLFFTHHKHLVSLAQNALPSIEASVSQLAA